MSFYRTTATMRTAFITDACSRQTWCSLTNPKEPPVNILDMFLTLHGAQEKTTLRSIRIAQGGEFVCSEDFRKIVSKHGFVVKQPAQTLPRRAVESNARFSHPVFGLTQ
jgi:hypothetical protein